MTTSMLDEGAMVHEKERPMLHHYPLTAVYVAVITLVLIVIELLKAFVF